MFVYIEDQRDRRIPEWEEAFALTSPLRRGQHYMKCACFIALSTRHHPDLLRRYWELCRRIPADRTIVEAERTHDQPYWTLCY